MKNIKQLLILFLMIMPLSSMSFDRYSLQYQGHLSFSEEFGIEGFWSLRDAKGSWFARQEIFTGFATIPEFDFFEVPLGLQSDIYNFKSKSWQLGLGLAASGSATTDFSSFSITNIRICPYVPYVIGKLQIRTEYCIIKKYGDFKFGIGVQYAL